MKRNFILLLPLAVLIFLVAGALISNLTYVYPVEEEAAEPFAQAFMEAGFAEGSDQVDAMDPALLAEKSDDIKALTAYLKAPYEKSDVEPQKVRIEKIDVRRHGFKKLYVTFRAHIENAQGDDIHRTVRVLVSHPKKDRGTMLAEKAVADGPILGPIFDLPEEMSFDDMLDYKFGNSYKKQMMALIETPQT